MVRGSLENKHRRTQIIEIILGIHPMLGELGMTNGIITRYVSNVEKCMDDDLVVRIHELVLGMDRKDIR